jgi:hypothetical protein
MPCHVPVQVRRGNCPWNPKRTVITAGPGGRDQCGLRRARIRNWNVKKSDSGQNATSHA